ncbi:MAG: PF20097 family protein [Planctomycetota bacterium]
MKKTCPKCAAVMDSGFILDVTDSATHQAQWAEGEAKKSFWFGVRVPRDERHLVTTYRCSKCGYLESYA